MKSKIDIKGTYIKFFWVCLIGSIVGTYYEQILNLIWSKKWESRACLIYGPFNIMYGIGLALFMIFLGRKNETRKWYKTFIYSILIGGLAEYIGSFIVEKFYNMKFWDYSDKFLSVNGRTTVIYAICWGIVGVVFMKFIYPQLEKIINKVSSRTFYVVTYILSILLFIDMLISFSALYRYNLRMQDIQSKTKIGCIYDKIYNDSIIEKVYSNMVYIYK